jgi:Xaa-Pro aminopeptidase
MDICKEKIEQAIGILDELNIDLWLIFCRESDMMADPTLDLIVGDKVVWQSAFFIGRRGETIALVGNFDAPNFERSGRFQRVIPFVQDCGKEIAKNIKKIKPNKIALNYSLDNTAADGLTHGMYLLLKEYLKGTPYQKKLISAEPIISSLRGRKTRTEIELLKKAASLANSCWNKNIHQVRAGMTEIEIARMLEKSIIDTGNVISFETIVNAGAKTSAGHGHPTGAILEKGDLLHVDFGAQYKKYCSDIQRLAYFKRDNESEPPGELASAFNTVRDIISEVSQLYKPGVKGYKVDAVARKMLRSAGYPEYQHALGHQIGRSVHDGSALVGPKWKRYGNSPNIPLEEGNAFTIEFGIELPRIGYVGLEENLVVTPQGGEFLCPRQMELIII